MSLLAEVVVEEWLNRQGYFTIRGLKIGVDEIDILAIRQLPGNTIERRHIEVQASFRPMSYITPLPKAVRKKGSSPTSAKKRDSKLLAQAVEDWVYKKFQKPKKQKLLQSLGGGWSRELVIHNIMHEDEVNLIGKCGIKILKLRNIIKDLRSDKTLIEKASGADLLELMSIAWSDDAVLAEAVNAVTEG